MAPGGGNVALWENESMLWAADNSEFKESPANADMMAWETNMKGWDLRI